MRPTVTDLNAEIIAGNEARTEEWLRRNRPGPSLTDWWSNFQMPEGSSVGCAIVGATLFWAAVFTGIGWWLLKTIR